MEKRLLALGDVVGQPGLENLTRKLRKLKTELRADFCVVNGENACGVGLLPQQADALFRAGADAITLGNHSFSRREIIPYIEREAALLRPDNLPPQQPGSGVGIFNTDFGTVALVDLIGRCAMDYTPENPFLHMERLLKKIDTKLVFVEIHAEATSEKLAMGYLLDGRAVAVWGTHTHVQTADESVLPHGTGYITDLGMCGPRHSILGIRPEQSVARFRGDLTGRYETAPGPCKIEGCLFTFDTDSGRCLKTERVVRFD